VAAACGTAASPGASARDGGPSDAQGADSGADAPREGGVSGDGSLPAAPLPRTSTQLVSWRFVASDDLVGAEVPGFDDGAWSAVSVPHTFDGKQLPFVTHSHAWYRTHFTLDRTTASGRIYVDFEGAGTISDVYVNGKMLGEHRGLYTRFVFDATDATVVGDNVLAVRVDNTDADTADCLPSAPVARRYYEPYGGIYRKAWLLTVDPVHVAPTDLGSSGVYLSPSVAETGGDGSLQARAVVRNTTAAALPVHVVHHVSDASGAEVATLSADATLAAGATTTTSATGTVKSPHRWSPGDPYLYTVATQVSVAGALRDAVTEKMGFRHFAMTPTAFYVNGVATPLRGVAKHQESEQHFTAMTDAELAADWAGMRAVGFDYVRLAHYPHAKLEYDQADALGIVVWAENGNSTPYPWTQTGDTATREMVRQLYNHPSIAFWSAGNETVSSSVKWSVDAAVKYAQAIRQEDPSRLVTYASNDTSFSDPAFDFIAQNLYEGLWTGDPWAFEPDAAKYHWVSENGSRSVVTQHDDYATAVADRVANVFEPEEFIQPTAEASAEIVFNTQASQVPLYTWWAWRDFQLDGRLDGICNNGMVTWDGAHAKDHQFLFQSFLRSDPVVHLVGALYYVRRGAANNGIKAYSNAASLHLSIDGTDMGWMSNGAYQAPNGRTVHDTFYWPVTLYQGPNYVHVDDGSGHGDDMMVVFAGSGGQSPPSLGNAPIVASVTSSNPQNPAYFIDRPIAPDVPVFYDLGHLGDYADNSFAALPPQLVGAKQIATQSTSKPQNLTDVSVGISSSSKGADVYLVTTDDGSPLAAWTATGFKDTGTTGTWRDAGMNLVPFELLSMRLAPGAVVKVAGMTRDYAVLVQPVP
jgi:beta-galactosidase